MTLPVWLNFSLWLRSIRHTRLSWLLSGLLLLLCACDGVDGDRVRIRFWNGFTGPDGRTMLQIIKQFNAENPDVHVVMQRMDWNTYYNKLFVAGLGNRAPEVFVIHVSNLERFHHAQFLRPLNDLIEQSGMEMEDFSANIRRAVQREGNVMAVPLDVHMIGMWYNAEALRAAGFVDAAGAIQPPQTRDQFMRAMNSTTRDTDGDGNPDRWGFVYTWLRVIALSIMRQYGGEPFNEDYTRCTLDSPENVAALEYMVDLVREHRWAPPPENFDSWIGFRQGRVAMAFEGIWMINDLRKQTDLDYGAAPVPVIGEQPAVWANAHTLCLPRELEGERLAAAWRFIEFLSDHSLAWAKGGQVPARISAQQSPEFLEMTAQATFARQIPYVFFDPQVPFIFEFNTEVDEAMERALRGSQSPREALELATERVNAVVERYRKMQLELEETP